MSPLHKLTTLALCIAATTFAGCASAPKKPVAATTETPAAATPADKPAESATDAKTAALNGNGDINGSGTGDDAANGGSGQGANGRNGKAGGQGVADNDADSNGKSGKSAPDMAQLLATRLVHFDYDSSDLQSADYQTLLAHAQYLKKNPNAKVTLGGHADERGTREYNMALGERRAKSVEAFLTTNGAKPSQLDTVSYGKEKPVNDGHDEAAWAENRRVEISYDAGEPH